MNKIFFQLFLILFFLSGCFSNDEIKDIKNKTIGERKITYYSNKSVTSLEIPPDLTSPENQQAFRLSEFVNDIDENFISFNDKKPKDKKITIREKIPDIQVKKSGNKRWLFIDKPIKDIWYLSQDFLKIQGFAINISNEKTGIIETDYLENTSEAPDQAVGILRSLIREGTGQSYSSPSYDKYRIRLEPINDGNQTELFLSLYSKEEVVKATDLKESDKVWITKPKDYELETEMLLMLMSYLGNDVNKSRELIEKAVEERKIDVIVANSINGYAKLVFNEEFLTTWDSLSWALDIEGIDISDKDIKDKAIYISTARTSDKGVLTKIFGDDAVRKNYQLLLKQNSNKKTEVFFNDISEENEKETKNFSFDLFNKIKGNLTK